MVTMHRFLTKQVQGTYLDTGYGKKKVSQNQQYVL